MSATRDGGMDRRAFVRGVARAAAAVAAGGVGIGRASELLAATPWHDAPLGAAGKVDRPFNMICLGDSVMWGQGLKNSSKFTTQVQNWLQSQLGRQVNNLVLARSGATIKSDGTVPAPWMTDRTLNEVPCSIPYVLDQVTMAHNEFTADGMSARDVDLVLVDGGANDVNITTILSPFPGVTTATLRSDVINKVGGPMQELLKKITGVFPTAKVVVTGYYPPVGPGTDLTALVALLAVLFPLGIPAVPFLKAKLREQSDTWFEESNAALAAAVNAQQGSRDYYYGTTPIQFARLDSWQQQNCYASGDPLSSFRFARSWLYLVAYPDEVFLPRQGACIKAGKAIDLCRDASMGHPNPDGAIEYANAIIPLLKQYLNEWQGLKLMQACIEMDPLPVPGKPSMVTVSVVERHTTTPVPNATVRIGSQTIPANTPVSLTLCKTSTVTRVEQGIKRKTSETVDACTPIVITAPGFANTGIDNYPYTVVDR